MQIPRIARLHPHEQPETVQLRVDLVRLGGFFQLLEHVARTDAPAFVLDGDVGGRVVVGLEEEFGVEVGGEVGGDELGVLAAGLRGEAWVSQVRV